MAWNKGLTKEDARVAKYANFWLGKKLSESHKMKLRLAKLGKKLSPEHRLKMSLKRRGKDNPNYGKGHMILGKNNPNYGNGAKMTRDKNPMWKGGISFIEYPCDWTETLRRSIRERDNYICKICNKIQGDIAHDVHHIDYDKKNCDPNNLITLCHTCHMKTNSNRDKWIMYFKNI